MKAKPRRHKYPLACLPADLSNNVRNMELVDLLASYAKLNPLNYSVLNCSPMHTLDPIPVSNSASVVPALPETKQDTAKGDGFHTEPIHALEVTDVNSRPVSSSPIKEIFPRLPHDVTDSVVPVSMTQVFLFNSTCERILLNIHPEGFATPIGSRFPRGAGIRLNAAVSIHFQLGLGLRPTDLSIFHQERYLRPNSQEQVKIYYITAAIPDDAFEHALAFFPHSYASQNRGPDQDGKLPSVSCETSSISEAEGRLNYLIPMAVMHLRTPFALRSLD